MPVYTTTYGMLVNEEIFEKNKIAIPKTYDELIGIIKSCTDTEVRYQLMHRAEDLLMSTGAICPLYYYTDLYMLDDNVKGFFSTPLGFKYFMYCTVD